MNNKINTQEEKVRGSPQSGERENEGNLLEKE